MNKTGFCAAVGAALVSSVFAADWPQFCGPDRNNVSTETGLADAWPSAGPKVLWETEVHDGYSGPAIMDGKVYFIDRAGEESLLRCLELASGKELWKCAFADPGTMSGEKYAGTRGTPTVTGDAIFLMTGYGALVCIDPKTQQVKWRNNLVDEFQLKLHQWGFAQSPCLHGDMVLVSMDGIVAAYDQATGMQRWTSPKLGLHGYVSPQVYALCGTEMVVAVGSNEEAERSRGKKKDGADESKPPKKLQKGRVAGLSLKDGSILWDYEGWQCKIAIPHPVLLPDNRLFITGGYDADSAMIQIEKKGDAFSASELYTSSEVGAQLHQPILVGKHLFIGSNTNNRKDGLASFHIDGKLEWRTKDIDGAPNFERGPFIMADGKLIILDGKTGSLHLVKADPEKYTELASAKLVEENDMAWAPLALSDGKLLLRDWNTLKCVDLKK